MRTDPRILGVPRESLTTEADDGAPTPLLERSGETEVIELTRAHDRKRRGRTGQPQMTLLGPGVGAREPVRSVHVDPSLFEPEPAPPPIPEPAPDTIAEGSGKTPTIPKLEIVRAPAVVPEPDPADPEKTQPAARPDGPDRWGTFRDLGLDDPKPKKRGGASLLQRLVVNTYRLIGFAILTIIVVVLLGYIATTVFYYANTTWATPVAVSPGDDKVVAARAELLAQQDQRARTAAELAQTERVIAAHRSFQAEFAAAIRGDRNDRQAALARLRGLASSAASTRAQIRSTNDDYAKSSEDRMSKELQAGLIDRSTALNGKYQLAQIAGANLSLAEREAEYAARADELAAQATALDAIASGKGGGSGLTYDVLKIKRDYETSRLDLAKALGDRDVLKASLTRQDQTIADLQQSAYLRAYTDQANVALVPYKNLEGVGPGTPLYACRAGFLWCHQVGSVVEVLRGEINFKHPHKEATVRGQMVQLKLTDEAAAKDDVLFLGSAPLGF